MGGCEGNPYPTFQTFITGIDTPFAEGGKMCIRDSLYGVELDPVSGRIAKQLYPKADITVGGFETTDRRDFFDLEMCIRDSFTMPRP